MKIYTKTGDKGDTSLLGGHRVRKSACEIEAIGSVDELNSAIGLLYADLPEEVLPEIIQSLRFSQHKLFTVGSHMAAVQTTNFHLPVLTEKDTLHLEQMIDWMDEKIPVLSHFILPGGHRAASTAFLARAMCRRAERAAVLLGDTYPNLPKEDLYFLNRLGDYLFTIARYINHLTDSGEIIWEK